MKNFKFNFRLTVLLLALFAGVGQMWADSPQVTFYVAVDINHTHWDNNCRKFYSNIKTGGNNWQQIELSQTAYTYNGKTVYQGTHTFTDGGYNNWQFYIKDGSGNNQKYLEWYAGDWNTTLHNGQVWDWTGTDGSDKTADHWKTASWDNSYTVYLVKQDSWSTCYAYTWNGYCDYNGGGYPGVEMSSTGKSYNEKPIYKIDLGKRYQNIKFSDNGDGSRHSGDQTLISGGTDHSGEMYNSGWGTFAYDVTLDMQGGSGGTSYVTAECGSAMPGSKTAPSRSGYTFQGYYTAEGGGGTQYYTSAMASANNWPSDGSGPTTLYAKWTQSVTLNQNGATTDGTTSVTATYKGGIGSIANNPSKTGYDFGGYYPNNDGTGGMVINTSKALVGSVTNWTDGSTHWIHDGASTLYAKWSQSVTLNANTSNHGSGDNTTATKATLNATAVTGFAITGAATGYHVEGYYTGATDGSKVLNADGTYANSNVTNYITSGKWTKAGATTLYAHLDPNTYSVRFNKNDEGATGSMDNQTLTYNASETLNSCTFTKTGYHFAGWAATSDGAVAHADGATKTYNLSSTQGAVVDLYAVWAPNTYSIIFNKDDEDATGSMSNQAMTYDVAADLSANTFAKNGYYVDGWAVESKGAVVYTAGQNVRNLTATNSGTVTLYAHWTKVTVTNLTFSPAQPIPGETATVTPVLSDTPTGTSTICWGLFYDLACTTAVDGVTFTGSPSEGTNSVSFTAPTTAGSYYVRGIYRTGANACESGTALDTIVRQCILASEHTVTIKYMVGSTEIAERTSVVVPAGDSIKVGPKEVVGYTFSSWDADPVVKLGTRDGDSVKIGATYDGTLTAVYTRKNLIFFKNTLGWEDVYIHFNGSSYWNATTGTGNYTEDEGEKAKRNKQMTHIEGTDVWYFDYQAASITPNNYLVFTDRAYTGNGNGYGSFHGNSAEDIAPVVYPIVRNHEEDVTTAKSYGFNAGTPMYVPLTNDSVVKEVSTSGGTRYAKYFNLGYWREYEPSTGRTGYTLEIYNKTADDGRDSVYILPMADASGDDIFEVSAVLEGNKTYGIKFRRDNGMRYTANGSTLEKDGTPYTEFYIQAANYAGCGLATTVAGEYTFRITCDNTDGKLKMAVTYPANDLDYRLVYCDTARATHHHPSDIVHNIANSNDIVSFFVRKAKNPTIQIQYCSIDGSGTVTWNNYGEAPIALADSSAITENGVYNFYLSIDGTGNIGLDSVRPYTGAFYIRTDAVGGTKWSNYRDEAHQMTYSDYSFKQTTKPYSHYFMSWVAASNEKKKNIKFTVANDYSPCISDTLARGANENEDAAYKNDVVDGDGFLKADANIRFMYNKATNEISRAYISGSTNKEDKYLLLKGSPKMLDKDGRALTDATLGYNNEIFSDDQNWMYEVTVQAYPGANVKIVALYNTVEQYLGGSGPTTADSVYLLGGTGTSKYTIKVMYDFKTNRFVTAWVPGSTSINDSIAIHADVMLIRDHQEDPQSITIGKTESKNYGALTEVQTVYGVMRFNRWLLNNRAHPEDKAVEHCTNLEGGGSVRVMNTDTINKYHPVLGVGEQKSVYERSHYYISFPFDVHLSDVFGFGNYWDEWYVEYYDGRSRAKNGYWIDSKPNWKYVTTAMRDTFVLKAYEGYILGIDLDYMLYNNTNTWTANTSEVSLYFPSSGKIDTISQNQITVKIDTVGYQCKINRNNGPEGDRRVKDSHWHCIGVPSYSALVQPVSSSAIDDNYNWATQTAPYVYSWNMTDNSLTPVATSGATTFTFQPMHAYLVQYAKPEITWVYGASTPQKRIVERNKENDVLRECEFRLELQKNGEMADQTYVRLTDDENVTTDYEFNYDLVKEMNSVRSNVYTFIGYEKAAANMLPLQTEQTTTVPVGVLIREDGEYTFAMVDGTHGIGVTLLDNVLNTRTCLSGLDYTVNLTAGEYNNRFMLEISPITETPTDVELLNGVNGENGVRKVMIDGMLYLVKDGKMYDARGARVQ